jgi:hypothetical protein
MPVPPLVSGSRPKPILQCLILLAMCMALAGATAPALADGYLAEYLAPFAVPTAINEHGAVVGWNPVFRTGFVYDDLFGYVALPCAKTYRCEPVDINDSGVIAGVASTPGILGQKLAVYWVFDGASYRLVFLPPIVPGAMVKTEAVSIDSGGRILGVAQSDATGFRLPPNFIWSPKGGYLSLPVPGRVVDFNDRGQVAGNEGRPYIYDLATDELIFTEVPAGFVRAFAHSISPTGLLAGSLLTFERLQVGAITDKGGTWAEVGGGSTEDHVFGINRFGDFAGHIRGLDPSSHCGVLLVEDGELATLESYLFKESRSWRMFEVAGITDGRLLAAETVNDVTGLRALVRLSPSPVPDPCRNDCIWVSNLKLARSGIAGNLLGSYIAAVQVAFPGKISPAKVEAVWVMNGGSFVSRVSGETGPSGRVTFHVRAPYPDAEIYVTRIVADGYRFDPTTGVLHATTGGSVAE